MCYRSRTMPQLLAGRHYHRHLFRLRVGFGTGDGGATILTVPSGPRIHPESGGRTRPGQEDKPRGVTPPRQRAVEMPRQERGKAILRTVGLFATGR